MQRMNTAMRLIRFSFCLWFASWFVGPPTEAKDIPMIYSAVTASESVVWVAHETGLFQKHGINAQLEALQDSYNEYAQQLQRLPYVEAKAMQTVLQTLGESQPALKARPEQFIDHSTLQKLERSGFLEKLYGR